MSTVEEIITTGMVRTAGMNITSMCMRVPHLCLPFQRDDRSNPYIVFAHGAAITVNPLEKSHLLDPWTKIMSEINAKTNISYLSYTARGHGESYGWQATASDTKQFSWERMGSDMTSMLDAQHIDKFIGGGASMGAAAAIYNAIQHPERMRGLIIIKPPAAWNDRALLRSGLLERAKQVKDSRPSNELYHLVLEGGANSDLPSKENQQLYSTIKCPVLILAVDNDSSHPISSAKTLAKLIPHAKYHERKYEIKAIKDYPKIIQKFLKEVHSNVKKEPPTTLRNKKGKPNDFLPFSY
jgi:3-oxoadipate enol-lactonase